MPEKRTEKPHDLVKNEVKERLIELVSSAVDDDLGLEKISPDLLTKLIVALREYGRLFRDCSINPNDFLSISDIEHLHIDTLDKLSHILRKITWEKLKQLDEQDLIAKKKGIQGKRNKFKGLSAVGAFDNDSFWKPQIPPHSSFALIQA
jgi:hypothetical protein